MTEPDREWIYAVDGERRGPLSAKEIAALISGDRLPQSTLVWKPGMAEWRPAYGVQEIAGYCAPPLPDLLARVRQDAASARLPPPLPSPGQRTSPMVWEPGMKSLDGMHPWRRYFARMIDASTLDLPVLALLATGLYVITPERSGWFTKAVGNEFLAGLIFIAAGIPVEALLLSGLGTTPGKWLFGVSVRRVGGGRLGFVQAMGRAISVFVQGMGFGIPIVSIFTLVSAHQRLQKTGSTLWDAATDSVVSHVAWGPWRWVFAVLAVLASITVLFLLSILEKAFSRA